MNRTNITNVDVLSLSQVEQGISKTLETANELLNAAETLNSKGHINLATSLFILAAEETGKSILIYRTILFDRDMVKWGKFWKDYKDHRKKLLAGLEVWSSNFFNLEWDTRFGRFINESMEESTKEFNIFKQSGFYTNFNSCSGKFEGGSLDPSSIYFRQWPLRFNVKISVALFKSGYFKTDNLKKLKEAFDSRKGRELLEKYRKLKKLRSNSDFSKEYDEFISDAQLNDLDELWRNAFKRTPIIDGKPILFGLLPSSARNKILKILTKIYVNIGKHKRKVSGWLD